VGLVVAAGLLAAPPTGHAHAGFRSAEPPPGASVDAPPTFVRVVLSAPVEEEFLVLRVTASGAGVLSGRARRDPRDPRAILVPVRAAAPGGVSVRWRVLSRDGHPSRGSYRFGVGRAVGDVIASDESDHGPTALLARLLGLAGPLAMVGLVTLAAGVVAPALRSGGVLVPGQDPERIEQFRVRAQAALSSAAGGWWLAWWSALAAGAAGLMLGPAVVLAGLDEGLGALGVVLGDTRFGVGWWVQAIALAATALVSVLVRGASGRRPPERPGSAMLLATGPVVALAAISWWGHASVGADSRANTVIDLLHNLATAAWIGGLLGLAVLVSPAVARLGQGDRVRLAAAVVVRFSALALAAVAVLVVTGVYRALAEVPVADLLDTGYGRVLLVKLGLFALLLVGGAYNRMVVHPRLERAALGLEPDDRGAALALRVSVRAELALGAALLVSVAVLVSLPAPG
jgi:copper transport protein